MFRHIALQGAVIGLTLTVPAVAVKAQTTSLVSISSNGVLGNNHSMLPSISADGRIVAFWSYATNLVQNDTNGVQDIFVHDRATGATTRISVSATGEEADNYSNDVHIDASGRYVAFQSAASNLMGDKIGGIHVYVHDRETGQQRRVSVASNGTAGNDWSFLGQISADGRFVCFTSFASNLVPGDSNGTVDAFVHDRQTGQTTRVSVSSAGQQGNGPSGAYAISADGRFVAIASHATNLVQGDTNGSMDAFVHDRLTAQTTRISIATDGQQGNGASVAYALSADGRYAVLESDASNFVANDTNDTLDIFVHDRQTAETTCVSVSPTGQIGNGGCNTPTISANGRYVAFGSVANNLVANDTNGHRDAFVRDLALSQTRLISISNDGAQGDSTSGGCSFSANAVSIAFVSYASNLVSGDTNQAADIFVRDRGARCGGTDINCDGVVDSGDLFLTINGWGPCSPQNCAADVAPPGGDGIVNVSDLLLVINNWG